jgi:alpha-galactosidase
MKQSYPATLVLLLLFIGCGDSPQTGPALLVIGNSITYTAPDPSIDWSGNWGMAASAAPNDFAHITAAGVSLPLTISEFKDLEETPAVGVSEIPQQVAPVHPGTVLVVELGDNVSSTSYPGFLTAYPQFLSSIGPRQQLICVSTFWNNPTTDAVIQAACASNGGAYIYIGDIYGNPANPDFQTVTFSDPAVQVHPHDWSHAQIAQRVLAAIPH